MKTTTTFDAATQGDRRSPLRAIVVICVMGLPACSWSVPADPGKNAALRGRPAPVDDGARTLYVQHCSRCHEPFSPSHATAEEWPSLVRRYGPRAGLFGD